jgi:hypothetical protein
MRGALIKRLRGIFGATGLMEKEGSKFASLLQSRAASPSPRY